MINTLERRERAAHLGDSDILFFHILLQRYRPCLSMYEFYYVAPADGEGLIRTPPGVKPYP
jgi:hypothetical protein